MSCMISRVRTGIAKSPAYQCGRETVIQATYICRNKHDEVIDFCLDHTLLISKMSRYCATEGCTQLSTLGKQEATGDVKQSWNDCRPCRITDEWHKKCTCIVRCTSITRCHGNLL